MQTMKINDASENEIVKQRFSQLLLIEKFLSVHVFIAREILLLSDIMLHHLC